MKSPILDVRNLELSLVHQAKRIKILHSLSFEIKKGEVVGIVGESGSGKSLTASSILGLLPPTTALSGEIFFNEINLLGLSEQKLSSIRGTALSLILQDPSQALNPLITICKQLIEGICFHKKFSRKQAEEKGIEWLNRVGINDPKIRMNQYPHELSGGMKQRIVIAMALINQPALLIADEPTTALDVTTQAQILDLLLRLQKEENLSLLLITHDLGVIARCCSRVIVMHKGTIVEQGSINKIFTFPDHLYTKHLIHSKNDFVRAPILKKNLLLEVKNLTHRYEKNGKKLTAVNNVSFSLFKGEILGIGGESGCGKSTIAKLLMGLLHPSEGVIELEGKEIGQLASQTSQSWRKKLQMIFQYPSGSLNPRMTIEKIIIEPFIIHSIGSKESRLDKAKELLKQVNLPEECLKKLPHQLSGGQKQRVAIARALALEPQLLICDEPFSALDASIQSQILTLLFDLHKKKELSYLIISHDLFILRDFTHRLVIMYSGEWMEWGPYKQVYETPRHPYTQMLVNSVLPFYGETAQKMNVNLERKGAVNKKRGDGNAQGCSFYSRCPYAKDICQKEKPVAEEVSEGHFVVCHF